MQERDASPPGATARPLVHQLVSRRPAACERLVEVRHAIADVVDPGPTPGPTVPGPTIIVNWSAPSNHALDDWVGMYRAGTPDAQYLARQFVAGGTTGTQSFALPSTPGRYEFRYFLAAGPTRGASSNVVIALPGPACVAQANDPSACAP